jgi:hypothetical protein
MTFKDSAEQVEAFASGQHAPARDGNREEQGRPEGDAPPNDAVRIGRVVSVEGSQVIVLLDGLRTLTTMEQPDALQIGALVKMRTPETTVFGMVCGLSIPIPSQSPNEREMRIVELELVGEAMNHTDREPMVFRRGISFCPPLGENVYAATQQDLKQVYAKPDVASARIGTIYQDQSLPAFIAIDDLLGKHFAVLGTTGSGKSCAVAVMLKAILEQHREGHILLLDLHNEYSHAFKGSAEVLGPGGLKLPYWLLNLEELRETLIDRAENREADLSILKEAVIYAKQAFNNRGNGKGTTYYGADSPVPYRMSDVIQRVEESLGRLERPTDSAPYLRLRERIEALQGDRRFDFMFQEGLTVRDTMADVLSQLFRIPANGRPVTILDLSEIPSDIMNVVISLVCRLTFDFALWSDRSVPILLVCEEAHRYAGENTDASFEPTKRALSKIAREGRKYGVSVCLVSQRPSELPVGILSQCNTIFAMRMSNQKDQEFVRGTLSESGLGLMDSLPSLRTGEAIGVGEGVPVPVRFCFDHLPAQSRPHSGTACFSGAWKDSEKSLHFVSEVVERWRRQHR